MILHDEKSDMEMRSMLRATRFGALSLAITGVLLAAGCGSSGSSGTTGGGGGGSSKVLVGAGSTLVAPLMSQWEPDYTKSSGVTITYGAIGSGGGIDAITARSVDFGASDAPLSAEQATACKDCLQVPWALAAVVPAYNLKGAPDHLKLSGEILAKMYLGQITSWDDAAIKALNPGVTLPSTPVAPIYRSDGSGDSYVWSSYLSAISPDFESTIGVSTQPAFNTGTGAEKSSGVAAAVQSTDGAIGYVTVAYITADKLNSALVQNAAGNFPQPTTDAITAAAAAVSDIKPDGSVSLVNPPASAADAYPISTYSYAIVPKSSSKATALQAFLKYAITDGQSFGPDLGYPSLPQNIVDHDNEVIGQIGS
jgi:phosphate transport system substrate-binding protein